MRRILVREYMFLDDSAYPIWRREPDEVHMRP
jgi:hypothetical protein